MRHLSFQNFVLQRATILSKSRSELAREAGISRESFYKILRGEISNPSIQTLHGLAIALEVSPIYLLRQYFEELNLGPGTLLSVTQPNDHVSFVRDVSFPDGSTVGINQTFVKTWEIQNTGEIHWEARRLVCQDDRFVLAQRQPDGSLAEVMDCHLLPEQREIAIPPVAPGECIQLSVKFLAPAFPCTVISTWKIVDHEGRYCFPEFLGIWASIRVVAL